MLDVRCRVGHSAIPPKCTTVRAVLRPENPNAPPHPSTNEIRKEAACHGHFGCPG